jgi:hypothetical protein
MIDLSRPMDAEAQARVYLLRLWPGERVPYITGRAR